MQLAVPDTLLLPTAAGHPLPQITLSSPNEIHLVRRKRREKTNLLFLFFIAISLSLTLSAFLSLDLRLSTYCNDILWIIDF